MAKTGTITVSSGHASQTAENASVLAEVAPPRPTASTLGAVVKGALKGLSVAGLALVDVANRKVAVATRNAEFFNYLSSQISDLSGDMFEFVPADPTKSSSGWSIKKNGSTIGQTLTGAAPTGLGGLLSSALGFSQPARSLESLVSAIEDATAEAGVDAVILIDQVAEKVLMSHCADLSAEWADPTAAMFGNINAEGAGIAFTVADDTQEASGIPTGNYRISGGANSNSTVSITDGYASASLGSTGDGITLIPVMSFDSSSRKVAVVTQTVLAAETSGTGMFAS